MTTSRASPAVLPTPTYLIEPFPEGKRQVALGLVDPERDVLRKRLLLDHLVAAVEVAFLRVLDHLVVAVIGRADDLAIPEQVVLVGRELELCCGRERREDLERRDYRRHPRPHPRLPRCSRPHGSR